MADIEHVSTVTMDELKDAARCGKLRYRAFGEEWFFGASQPFYGDLDRAAEMLPSAFNSGLVRLYRDANGLFLGPTNQHLIEHDPLAEDDEVTHG